MLLGMRKKMSVPKNSVCMYSDGIHLTVPTNDLS